jgi:hypothetical protein
MQHQRADEAAIFMPHLPDVTGLTHITCMIVHARCAALVRGPWAASPRRDEKPGKDALFVRPGAFRLRHTSQQAVIRADTAG